MQPKILTIDIETAPMVSCVWGYYDQNLSQQHILEPGYIICYAYKWYHKKKVEGDSIHLHPGFTKNPKNDKVLAKKLWKLLDEADILVAHNGKKFDTRHMNSLFLRYIGHPPSPYKIIDTLTESKANFYEPSYKLNDLSIRYGIGKKIDTGGIELWKKCMNGHVPSMNLMYKYCKHDIEITEGWYTKMRSFIKRHPNYGLYVDNEDDGTPMCPTCGSEELQETRYAYTTTGKYQRYKCTNCGKESRGSKNLLTKEQRDNLRRNI